MSEARPNSEVLKFFLAEGSAAQTSPSLNFLAKHPSLLEELDRAAGQALLSDYPQVLGSYEIEAVLGRGAMAEVVRAKDTLTGHRVALKLVKATVEPLAAALQHEAAVLSGLEHPNVVKYVDHGRTAEWCWLALELVEGRTLAEWIEAQRARSADATAQTQRIETVIRWLRDLASGLAALHDVGSIHRDIKPGNVLMRDDGSVILIDFGLAQGEATASWGARVLAGTIPYMSPEQTLAGLIAIDRTSDVYSLAATMYEALCGSRTVSGHDRSNLLLDVAFGSVANPSSVSRAVPPPVDAIFLKALTKERQHRYADARQLLDDVSAYLEGRPLPHARVSLKRRLRSAIARHRSLLVAASLASVVMLLVWWGVEQRSSRERLALVDELESLFEDHHEVALRPLRDRLERYSTDEQVVECCRQRAGDIANSCAYLTMVELGFFLQGVTDVEGLRDRAALAAILDAIDQRSGFRFTIGVHEFLTGGPEAALRSLRQEQERVEGDVLLLELRAVMELEADDLVSFAATRKMLDGLSTSRQQMSSLAFRSYRHLRTAAAYRSRDEPVLPSRDESLTVARRFAELAVDSGLEGSFAATCLALIELEDGRFGAAAKRFEALVDFDRARHGAELYSILASALQRGEMVAADRERLASSSVATGVPASLLHAWIARQALGYGERHVATSSLIGAAPLTAAEVRPMVTVGYVLSCAAAEAAAWDDCAQLGAEMATWPRRDGDAELGAMVGASYALATWSGIHALEAMRSTPVFDRAVAVRLMAQTRECARVAIARGFGARFDALAANAIGHLYGSICAAELSERERLGTLGARLAREILDGPEATAAAQEESGRETLAFVRRALLAAER